MRDLPSKSNRLFFIAPIVVFIYEDYVTDGKEVHILVGLLLQHRIIADSSQSGGKDIFQRKQILMKI